MPFFMIPWEVFKKNFDKDFDVESNQSAEADEGELNYSSIFSQLVLSSMLTRFDVEEIKLIRMQYQ